MEDMEQVSKASLSRKTKIKHRNDLPAVNDISLVRRRLKNKMELRTRRRRRKKPLDHWSSIQWPGSARRSQNLLLLLVILVELLGDLGRHSSASSIRVGATQDVGEGLTLEPSGELDNPFGPNNKLEPLWPLQQLDKIKRDSKVSALAGQNVVLNCVVQFKDGVEKPFVVNWLKYPYKLPIYIWYAGYPPHVAQGFENRVSRIGQASLNLSDVRESDQGLYECKIHYLEGRPDDKTNGTWIFLDVQAPPHFIQTPTPVNYVQAGDSLHLTCQASSTPTPILRWYKNKLPIESDTGAYRLSSSVLTTEPNGSKEDSKLLAGHSVSQLDLFIDNVQAGTVTGDYTCLASNSEGSVEARSQVLLAMPAVITSVPRNQTRLEGDKVELLCQAKALPSNITYKWLFNDKPIQTLKWFESRHTVRRDGTLVIHSAHRDDQGQYKCQATNGLSHRNRNQSYKSKDSLELAPIYAEAGAFLSIEYRARVTYSPSPQYLPLGLSGVIRCFVQAAPPIEFFTWTFNNQLFDPNSDANMERLVNGSLLIRRVSRQYEGQYRCTPFNKHGSAGSSASMEVRVEDPPYFELKPAEFYKATVNGNVKIPCEGKGLPRPNVYWRKVEKQLPVSDKSNQGTNSAQTSASIPSDKLNDQPDHPSPLSIAETELEASQSPNLHQEQEQQSVIVYAKLPTDRSEYKNSHLLIHSLRKEDHGHYECVVENEVATLVVSTMLYIEETTPHAPTNIRVETKAWSAQVMWTPGYDGGFEQSFVVWYRQTESKNNEEQPQLSGLPQPVVPNVPVKSSSEHHEAADLSWRSVNVESSDATSLIVQNLSQDTSYEFYVRAKNIIGEGPRSQMVIANTKRAISGSLIPLDSNINVDPAASTSPFTNSPDEIYHQNRDEEDSDDFKHNPTVLGIIHLVDMTTTLSPNNYSPSNNQLNALQVNSVQEQQQAAGRLTSLTVGTSDNKDSSSSNSSKVIRIYFPTKQPSNIDSSDISRGLFNSTNSKRPRFEASESILSQAQNTTEQTSVVSFEELLYAPRNLSIMKVAQGWVLNWLAPKRRHSEHQLVDPTKALSLLVESDSSSGSESGEEGRSADGESSSQNKSAKSLVLYTVQYRVNESAWQTLASNYRERSLLLKDLKPSSSYTFKIIANSNGATKGWPSTEFKYLISDNRRKPGSTQALTAGVVSGFLFFVFCIVTAVGAVKICNKRRKERAEKAAYVMMACPVLESHHDIAALNSNSLMKNLHSSKGRISGVNGEHLVPNLKQKHSISLNGSSVGKRCAEFKRRALSFVQRHQTDANEPEPGKQHSSQVSSRKIEFSSNAPQPVDVSPADLAYDELAASLLASPASRASPIDDYWVRRPSGWKWGTLTLAASELAERRAREAQQPGSEADDWRREHEHGSHTLPRSFRASPIRAATDRRHHQDNWAQTESQQQFKLWLMEQLSAGQKSSPEKSLERSLKSDSSSKLSPPQAPARSKRAGSEQRESLGARTGQQFATKRPSVTASPSVMTNDRASNQATSLTSDQSMGRSALATLPGQHLAQSTLDGSVEQQHGIRPADDAIGRRNSLARSSLPLETNWLQQVQQQQPSQQPTVGARSRWAQDLAIIQQQKSKPICPFYPLLGRVSSHNYHTLNDDPVTENACLGSYKRKRRRAHIEAQFTIEPPNLADGKINETPGGPVDERDALQSGRLFVRSLPAQPKARCPPVSPLARALPQPGQRTEQRLLRQQQLLNQVQTIAPEEKIQTYLRHYETPSIDMSSPISSWSLCEPDKVEELTFQPYQNLPSLKYTINLPIRRCPDGSLLLGETNELRRSSRSSGHRDIQPTAGPYLKAPLRRWLGSSSSCPTRSSQSEAGDQSSRKLSKVSGRSLESALAAPTFGLPVSSLESRNFADSLESSATTLLEKTDVNTHLLTTLPASKPFYLDEHGGHLMPPPVPPHRNPSKSPAPTQQGNEIKPALTLESICQRPEPNFCLRDSSKVKRSGKQNDQQISNSSQSCNSSSTSASSSSRRSSSSSSLLAATTTGTANVDHSEDENYEFDLISSSSSSNHRHKPRVKNQVQTQVHCTKLNMLKVDDQDRVLHEGASSTIPIVERSRFYNDTTCKQLQLFQERLEKLDDIGSCDAVYATLDTHCSSNGAK